MIPLRRRLIRINEQIIANESMYQWLGKQRVQGATDRELQRAGHTYLTRVQLTYKGYVFDSGRTRDDHIVWTTGTYTPGHPDPRVIVQPPSTVENSRYGLGLGSHPEPIPPCARGTALTMAAIALEILTGRVQRLVWVVDLKTDVILTEDDLSMSHPLEPHGSSPKGGWGDLLFRLRAALDRQRWGAFDTEFAMWVHVQTRSTKSWAWVLFSIPWRVDLSCIPGRKAPVGRWLLQQLPPAVGRSFEREGDQHPGDWMHDGLPF